MKYCRFAKSILYVIFYSSLIATGVRAHEGHSEAPGESDEAPVSGPIAISAEAKENLGLTTVPVEVRTLENILTVIGQTVAIPNRIAAVSSRISGRVTELMVTEGESVEKGQILVEVESRQPGDPPPRVYYRAPMDGIVIERHIVLGATVEPDKHLLEIVDLSAIYAEGRIYEGQIASVKLAQAVRVYVESYPDEIFFGRVERFSGRLDPESRTLKVWVRIENLDGRLRPGMRCQLYVIINQGDAVIAVPHSAVLGEAGSLFVFVQSEDDELVYEKRPVVTGMKDDRFLEIIYGVYPGEQVVTVGNYQLQYVTPRKLDADEEEHTLPDTTLYADATAKGLGNEESGFSPLFWVGIAGVSLLFLNAVMLFTRRRRPAPVANVPHKESRDQSDEEPTDAQPSQTETPAVSKSESVK